MEYIFICPKCGTTYGYNRKRERRCDDCDIVTVYSGYNSEDWYAMKLPDRKKIKNRITNNSAKDACVDTNDDRPEGEVYSIDGVQGRHTLDTIKHTKKRAIEKTVESVMAYLKTNSPYGTPSGAAIAALPNVISSMDTDEEILHCYTASFFDVNDGKGITYFPIIIITTKKLHYAGGNWIGIIRRPTSGFILLKDIHSVTEGKKLRAHYVQFEAHDDDYRIEYYSVLGFPTLKSDLTEACKIAREAMNASSIRTSVSPADEIRKFKELLDADIITQEEFNAKKKQLLGL